MKYVNFRLLYKKPKTSVWDVRSHEEDRLGIVKWYPYWRQYCFFPETNCVFSSSCMESIVQFVQEANEEHKQKKGKP